MTRAFRSWVMPILQLAGLLVCALPALAGEKEAAVLQDLRADGQLSRQNRLPILVVVEQADCHYCKALDREVIHPMVAGGEYDNKKVILRRLDIASELPIRDFNGQPVTPSEFAHRYGAYVTPTLLFLDHAGRELAPKMVGLGTLDFYWTYLDEAIDAALAKTQPCEEAPKDRGLAQKGAAAGLGLC